MIEYRNIIKISSNMFSLVLFASSIALCQTFKLMNNWDGVQKLVDVIENHNNALKDGGNSEWLEEDDSLSAPFDDLTGNELASETDSEDNVKRQLTSSELNTLRNMKLELDNDMLHRRNPIKLKPDNIAKKLLDDFEMQRKETLVTLPNIEREEDKSEDIEVKRQNYRDILNVLANQLYVVENFVDYLKEEKKFGRQGKTEFDELLESIQNKNNIVKTTTVATTVSDVTQVPKLTLIDESDIRDALKNDPLVKRILKIAKKKRGQYMKEMEHA